MRVLITGAGGFVGRHLIDALLDRGHKVVGSTQNGVLPPTSVPRAADVGWLALELTSTESVAEAIEQARPDAVVHLAAQSSVGASFTDPLGTWEVNATGTFRLLHALRQVVPGARVLVVSSAEVYGVVPEEAQPIPETAPLAPNSPYGASKAAAEMVALEAAVSGELHVIVARSFNHTGPGQDNRFSLPSFARQLVRMRGQPNPVLRVGNLEARRDFLDVRDVVRAYTCLLEQGGPGAVYNVCSGRARSLEEIVMDMVRISNTGARIEVDPDRVRAVDVPLLVGDPARLRSLGWEARIPFSQTLADLLSTEHSELAR